MLNLSATSHVGNVNNTMQELSSLKELVIEIPGMNMKNENDVRTSIGKYDGVTFKGYCQSKNVLMYVIDRDVQPDNNFIDLALQPFGLTYVVKSGSTIQQVSEACGINTQSEQQ